MLPVWRKEFNDILRYIIFQDEELKTLMKVPNGTSILDFFDKYFIEMGFTDETLKNEAVRVVYGSIGNNDIPKVLKNEISFDIYVKKSELRNATKDRLMLRTHLVADRIKTLLTQKDNPNMGGYVFREIGESELGTSTVGYTRYNISFNYFSIT